MHLQGERPVDARQGDVWCATFSKPDFQRYYKNYYIFVTVANVGFSMKRLCGNRLFANSRKSRDLIEFKKIE